MGSFKPEDNASASQSAEVQDYSDVDAGAVLQRAREHYGLTLDDVEKHLHIRRSYLEAIEKNNPDALPGRVYAIGFIRTYAEFLGLDGGKIIQIYKRYLHEKDRPEFHVPIEASESKLPNMVTLGASAAALVVFVSAFVIFHKQEPKPPIQKPEIVLNEAEQAMIEPQIELDVFSNIAPAAGVMNLDQEQPKSEASRIVIYAQQSAWVEILDESGNEVVSKVLKPGDRYDVPDQEGLMLTTGNIGGLVLTLDGHDVQPLGENGDKLKNFHLSPAKLNPYLKISGN